MLHGEQKLKEARECVSNGNLDNALERLQQLNSVKCRDLQYESVKIQTRALAKRLCIALDYSLEELYLMFERKTPPLVSQYLHSVMVTAIS